MSGLFPVTDVDRAVYTSQLRDFLPARIVDVHVHVWRTADLRESRASGHATVSWPARVASENPIGDLCRTYELLFPGKRSSALIFPTLRMDLDAANAYCASCAAETGFPALLFSDPTWSGEELERRITAGGFIGVKSYLTFAPSYLPDNEIRVFDFLPPHQLEVLDAHGWLAMLHLPRPGRLGDPVNLGQLLEIDRRWPRLRCIVAHVGRAYCPEDVGDAFRVLRGTENLLFDISANTNAAVFEQLICAVGPRRILFGSDLPITRMRMRRICENGTYVNLVPPGLYGDVSGDPHLREVSAAEGPELSFFLYEEILAFRAAAERTGLGPDDIAAVFCGNALDLHPRMAGL